MDFETISNMKVNELKDFLRLRGLKVSGKKCELISIDFFREVLTEKQFDPDSVPSLDDVISISKSAKEFFENLPLNISTEIVKKIESKVHKFYSEIRNERNPSKPRLDW